MRYTRYALAIVAFLGVWISVAVYFDSWSLAAIANVGDALAPFGSAITVLALVFAFQQNRETADRAHRDKLADVYAEWFRVVRTALANADRELGQARLIFQKERPHGDEAMTGRRHILEGLRFAADLRVASTAVLLLEDDEQLRRRIEATFAPILRGPMIPNAILHTAVNHHVEVLNRRTAVEGLYSDVVVRLRGGVRPQPAAPEPQPEVLTDRD